MTENAQTNDTGPRPGILRASQAVAASAAVSQQAWTIWQELNAGNRRAAAFRARLDARRYGDVYLDGEKVGRILADYARTAV